MTNGYGGRGNSRGGGSYRGDDRRGGSRGGRGERSGSWSVSEIPELSK